MKPLGIKNYGSIPHLIGSRLGPADHHAEAGQVAICTEKQRDKHDCIIVQEKLDGGNVGVAKVNGKILAITRAGYLAETSPYKTHHAFKAWVEREAGRFDCLLAEGERACGEWLLTAVGTKYKLNHEPFVIFDIMTGKERLPYLYFADRVKSFGFEIPTLLHYGYPISINGVMERLGEFGHHGAIEPAEGAVWRVERKGKVDFLAKYVRPEKIDGKYLAAKGGTEVANDVLKEHEYLFEFLK